jgi:hypothetical protein
LGERFLAKTWQLDKLTTAQLVTIQKINYIYWKHLGPQYPQFPALCFPFALTAVEHQRPSARFAVVQAV